MEISEEPKKIHFIIYKLVSDKYVYYGIYGTEQKEHLMQDGFNLHRKICHQYMNGKCKFHPSIILCKTGKDIEFTLIRAYCKETHRIAYRFIDEFNKVCKEDLEASRKIKDLDCLNNSLI